MNGLAYLTEMTINIEGTGQIADMMRQMGAMKVTMKTNSISRDADLATTCSKSPRVTPSSSSADRPVCIGDEHMLSQPRAHRGVIVRASPRRRQASRSSRLRRCPASWPK